VAVYVHKAIRLINDQIEWIEKQLLLEQQMAINDLPKEPMSFPKQLTWTANKVDLIELLYALYAADCFNFGRVSLNQIAVNFEKMFDIRLTHFSRDYSEMRIRNDQTPFMDKLRTLLKERMNRLPLHRIKK